VPRLVLLGLPGSGKSSFARHLTLCLAGEVLGSEDANLKRLDPEDGDDFVPWPHGVLLPVFVELKKLVRSKAFPAEGKAGDGKHLLDYLAEVEGPEVGELVRKAFAEPGGGLLILDGLDETPAAEKCRERLRQVVTSFTRRYPEGRVLVTSRPYAYAQNSAWRLDGAGFEEATLAPFSDDQAKAYVDGWYRHLAFRGQVDPDQAERRAAALWHDVASTGYLRPLAERPLMLSMMADLHAAGGGRLRGGRAGIYEQSVELLLDRWNEIRAVEEGRSVGDLLGMNLDQLRRAVERLAFEVHRRRGAGEGGTAAEITESELLDALGQERSLEVPVDERRVKDYLHQRSGILFAESPSVYRFPHRSYQEYLAACYLNRRGPDALFAEVEAAPELWREVVLLAVGKVAPETPYLAWVLLEGLVKVSRLPGSQRPRGAPPFPRPSVASSQPPNSRPTSATMAETCS
jgi:predicted NACHT family NTPase